MQDSLKFQVHGSCLTWRNFLWVLSRTLDQLHVAENGSVYTETSHGITKNSLNLEMFTPQVNRDPGLSQAGSSATLSCSSEQPGTRSGPPSSHKGQAVLAILKEPDEAH
jgi:hypothetical protein